MQKLHWFLSIAVCTAIVAAHPAEGRELTIVSPGGAAQIQQKAAMYEPFSKLTGIPVKGDQWDNKLARIRAQIEANNISWDVVQVNSANMAIGCDEGLFERIDPAAIKANNELHELTFQKCGIFEAAWSSILTYDADKFPDGPKTWADFWNVKKWPGKRGLYFSPEQTLEQALMADGVPPKEVYKVLAAPGGVDRAFKKLDELKPHILWWRNGNESTQRLATGEVAMTAAWNGRITVLNRENKRNFKIVWPAGHYMSIDYFAIPKGSPNKEKAMKFLAFWATPEPEAAYMKAMTYGGPNKKAYGLVDKETLANLPSDEENFKYAAVVDVKFWADNLEALRERFNSWASK